MKIPTLLAVSLACLSLTARAESIICPATRDLPISSDSREADISRGKSPRIKLKGYQEFGLLDFDVSAIKGRKVTGATLHVRPDGGMKHGGEARGTDLRWFTISTIASEWEEGLGATSGPDLQGHGASFNEASGQTRAWSYPGSKVYDVAFGNGHSIRCDVDAGDPKDGWMVIPVEPKMIEAMVSGSTHGLLLMDGSVFISANCYIASRESKNAPYLTVSVASEDKQAPRAVEEAIIEPAPNDAGAKTGAAKVTLTTPEGAFSYDITVNGKPLPRWQIPFAAKAGEKQTFLLEYLEPRSPLKFEITTVNSAGNRSAPATFNSKASDAIHVPALPVSEWQPKGGTAPVADGRLRCWAVPEICKLDPITGAVMLEKDMATASSKNKVWDASDNNIRIAAARGEIAGAQIALQALNDQPCEVQLRIEGLDGIGVKMWRSWFVKVKDTWQPDYAIPMKPGEAAKIPDPQNQVPGQKVAVIAIDFIVPPTARPGKHIGSLVASLGGGSAVDLPVKLQVHATVIPDTMHFIPEMNCYSGPLGDAGSPAFNDAHKLAHYHRSAINRVPHSHSGNTDKDWTPDVDAKGRVTDWSRFDNNLGPLLDGSLFKDNPRAGVPVPALYLPFNESWPLPFKSNYNPGKDVPNMGDDWRPKHDIVANPPEASFNQDYKDAFTNCTKDFVEHFEAKRWNRTLAECYNNNKASMGNIQQRDRDGKLTRVKAMTGTAWTLDEPATLLDWQAIKFYSQLFHRGLGGMKTTHFVYRGDISRPQWQGNYMDGLMELMMSNGSLFNMMPLMKDHRRRMPVMIMAYGACNTQERSNHETTAWVLKAYTHECDGVLPWQAIGGDKAFDSGDFTGPNGTAANGNALIVDGRQRFGINAIASFRVHAFRCGAQIAELLRLLELKNGWSRAHSLALVSQVIPLSAEYHQKFTDDAAGLTFQDLNGNDLVRLKEGILLLLEK